MHRYWHLYLLPRRVFSVVKLFIFNIIVNLWKKFKPTCQSISHAFDKSEQSSMFDNSHSILYMYVAYLSAPCHFKLCIAAKSFLYLIQSYLCNFTLMLQVANFANTKWCKATGKRLKHWYNATHLRVLSQRAFKWIPTWQGLDGYQQALHACPLEESSLSIGRVKCSIIRVPYTYPASPSGP